MFEPATYAQTRLRRARPGPDDQRGFTLIELLVVIVILGILSAVVVFAVRGTGDKGQAASVSTDEKTIRTAEESYCAQNGKYGSGQQLVDGKFLSDLPQYHQVNAQPTGGTCNGWKFFINRTAQATPYPPGRWDPIAAPGLGSTAFMVRLADGRVLAGGVDPTFTTPVAQIWDPSTNTWTSQDPIPSSAIQTPSGSGPANISGNTSILLSDDPGTPQNECKSATVDNCGKVFVQGVALFNPKVAPGTGAQWESLPAAPGCNVCTRGVGPFFTYVQLKTQRGPCGTACGKIFMWANNSAGTFNSDIYDPKDNSYTQLPLSTDPATANISKFTAVDDYATQLSDGRIFLCCKDLVGTGTSAPGSAFLDPTSLAYSPGPVPPVMWIRGTDPQPGPVLPNGDLYFGINLLGGPPHPGPSFVSGTYQTQAGAAGQFGAPIACASGQPRNCRHIGSLPDGRVLTIRSRSPNFASTALTYVYNPATRTIDPGASLNNTASFLYSAVLLDPVGGRCGAYCGKMLVSGQQNAEVYTP